MSQHTVEAMVCFCSPPKMKSLGLNPQNIDLNQCWEYEDITWIGTNDFIVQNVDLLLTNYFVGFSGAQIQDWPFMNDSDRSDFFYHFLPRYGTVLKHRWRTTSFWTTERRKHRRKHWRPELIYGPSMTR